MKPSHFVVAPLLALALVSSSTVAAGDKELLTEHDSVLLFTYEAAAVVLYWNDGRLYELYWSD